MITFGTSGWRGIIADDFTFENVRSVTQAIAEYVIEHSDKNSELSVIVGYDTRFLSENFALETSRVLAGNGITALLCKRDTPTPVIAFEILRRKAAGGINFTASHNPPLYNGIKFSPAWGGPALPETTQAIEERVNGKEPVVVKIAKADEAIKSGLIKYIDPKPAYIKRIKELVDIKAINKAKLHVATDVLYGTGAGYLDAIIEVAGVRQKVLHNWRDVMFGGSAPEPNQQNLKELTSVVRKEACNLGVATDGDGDRFGFIDSDGSFINPNETIAVLLYHLIKNRGVKSGVVARSVMTTHLIDKVANKFGLEVKETPVGFKYIGEILVHEGKNFVIGGEESGGLTIGGHVPEKDGILACMLMVEMIAMSKKPIRKMLAEIEKLVGVVLSDRLNFHLTVDEMDALRVRLRESHPSEFAGIKVADVVTLDGYKYVLADGSWLGVRLSGTEPVVRLYIESDTAAKMKKLAAAGNKFIKGR
jgi:alpha-D-glucose phosphate-specific phosphoglucomutase